MGVLEYILLFVACGLAGYMIGFQKGRMDGIRSLQVEHYAAGYKNGLSQAHAENRIAINMLQAQVKALTEEKAERAGA